MHNVANFVSHQLAIQFCIVLWLRVLNAKECVAAMPSLAFITRRPTRRHFCFLCVKARPFSFFTRTTHPKINPADDGSCWDTSLHMASKSSSPRSSFAGPAPKGVLEVAVLCFICIIHYNRTWMIWMPKYHCGVTLQHIHKWFEQHTLHQFKYIPCYDFWFTFSLLSSIITHLHCTGGQKCGHSSLFAWVAVYLIQLNVYYHQCSFILMWNRHN